MTWPGERPPLFTRSFYARKFNKINSNLKQLINVCRLQSCHAKHNDGSDLLGSRSTGDAVFVAAVMAIMRSLKGQSEAPEDRRVIK